MMLLKRRDLARVELKPAAEDSPAIAVTLTPIGAADIELAAAEVRANLAANVAGTASLERYGVKVAEGSSVSAAAVTQTERGRQALLAIELGIRHIKSWEGVTTDGVNPAAPTPELVHLLFNEWGPGGESYGLIFIDKISGLSILEPGAPKGSAASPGTSTAAAARDADSAGLPETPAPAASA